MSMIIPLISSFWFQTIIKLVLGLVLSSIIGMERQSVNKPAGYRTYTLVGISGVLVMICGEYMAREYSVDPSRIPAQLLSGIGFIGAGTILRDGLNVRGLTTAAGLLAVACIGLTIGAGYYIGGIVATFVVYIVLSYSRKISDKLDHFGIMELEIIINKEISDVLKEVEKKLSEYGTEIKHIKILEEEDSVSKLPCKVILNIQYNKQIHNQNRILSEITTLEGVTEVIQK